MLLFVQASLDLDPPILCFLHCWDDRHTPSHPDLSVEMGFTKVFFAQLGLE
jgi:hypothetical protein